MRRTFPALAGVILMSAGMAAQEPVGMIERRGAVERAVQPGNVARVALESRVTKGKPYSAEAVTEFVHVLGDGNRIVRRNSERVYRDAEGRTRREPVGDEGTVMIADPVSGNSFVLDTANRTAFKSPGLFARVEGGSVRVARSTNVAVARREPPVEVITIPGNRRSAEVAANAAAEFVAGVPGVRIPGPGVGDTTKEELGDQVIEGITATGTRTTTTIAAGAIGNEQPITIVSEQWFSTDLGVLVMTRHSDPRSGETTYRLTNISRDEPDRLLFQVPADYAVRERAPIMRRF